MTAVKRGKNIFKTKTFWLNAVQIAAFVASGGLGFAVPAAVAVPIIGVSNIVNRLFTKEPARLPSPASSS